jgi:DnaJ-class molecular chaperone
MHFVFLCRVPTLEGGKEVGVRPGTQPGDRLRIRGLGIKKPTGHRGDHYVRVNVSIPRTLTKRQRQLIEEFAEESAAGKREAA